MASIKLNQLELDALSGLSHAAFRLYVAAIRPRMDFATGLVGKRVGISWQALREWMYVEARPGVKAVTHTESTVRRLVKQLVKHGLLREIGDRFRIAFACPLADRGSFAQKKADRGSTPPAEGGNANADKASGEIGETNETSRADTHLTTGIKNTPPTPPRRRRGRAEQPIDPSAPAVRKDDNPSDETPAGTQAASSSEERHESAESVGLNRLAETRPEAGFVWEAHLAWPVDLTQGQRANIARILHPVPEALRQVAMDEWRGRMALGDLGNPVGWLQGLVKRIEAPDFAAFYADEVRRKREAAAQVLVEQNARDAEFAAIVAKYGKGPYPKGVLATLTKMGKRALGVVNHGRG
ncbi:hypothetical protein [Cupriavidus oxalaticus]|uniref:Uncharacterized protein n=1 Tax=Cupriavidus oxalaticus TaxID=96344 RepID=A0A4P7LMS5_9BURK|nr:hypothetical protein [Cupriavidus oxalaticus]QBY56139.1 hypothetical protein E0W60_34335 [Cupriavidus oxalaticus]